MLGAKYWIYYCNTNLLTKANIDVNSEVFKMDYLDSLGLDTKDELVDEFKRLSEDERWTIIDIVETTETSIKDDLME